MAIAAALGRYAFRESAVTKPIVTLAASWAAFEQLALSDQPSNIRAMCRGCYYSGAAAMWGMAQEAKGYARDDKMEALQAELETFRTEAEREAS